MVVVVDRAFFVGVKEGDILLRCREMKPRKNIIIIIKVDLIWIHTYADKWHEITVVLINQDLSQCRF